jgi:branched-chain amino acid aminotransferase
MAMSDIHAWVGTALGGQLISVDEPAVSVLDHGLLLGDGLFETVLTVGTRAIWLSEHLERLSTSATALELQLPPREVIAAAVTNVLSSAPIAADARGRLRITVTSGVGPFGFSRGSQPTLIVLWEPLQVPAAPAELTVSEVRRFVADPLPAHKHTSWLGNVLAHRRAQAQGFSDALILNDLGNIVETTTANVFGVKAGVVVTPPLRSGCLPGVTRSKVFGLLPAEMRFAEMDLTLEDLFTCDEVFLTSSLRLIQPVRRIGSTEYLQIATVATTVKALVEAELEQADD